MDEIPWWPSSVALLLALRRQQFPAFAIGLSHESKSQRYGDMLQSVPPRGSVRIRLKSDLFGFEPEITAKVARGNWRVYEVPISYAGRSYEEGKKSCGKTAFRPCGVSLVTDSRI
jgi:hypothetical protein